MDQDILHLALLSEARNLQDAIDNSGACVFMKDLDGRYTFVNEMVCEIFGLTADEIVGQTDESFFDLKACNEIRLNDQVVMATGQTLSREERNIVSSTGEQRVFWAVKRPIRDQSGEVIGVCGFSTDITERRRLEETVKEQQALLDSVLDNVDSYIYMKDAARRYLYANAKVCKLYGLLPEQLIGKEDRELMSEEMADGFGVLDRRVFEEIAEVAGEEIFLNSDGEIRHYWSVKLPLLNDGKLQSMVGISTDITEVVELREKFKLLANTDALTGVLSRRHWMERAEHELKRAHRNGSQLAVMVLDIDHFKLVNDEHGHLTGDKAIQAVASTCRQELRGTDLLGRLGGDEFVVLLPDSNIAGALEVAERLRMAMNLKMVDENGVGFAITSSLGVAISPSQTTIDEMVARADAALYKAKRGGRNQTVLYETTRSTEEPSDEPATQLVNLSATATSGNSAAGDTDPFTRPEHNDPTRLENAH